VWPSGWHVWYIEETGSTNADLLQIADDLPDRTVLFTGHQTAGRGRLDRRWDAPAGANLLVSVLFRDVGDDPAAQMRRIGLAVATAARELGTADVGLKWPNDVVVGSAKVAGILAERTTGGDVVVGTGVNVGWAPEGAATLAGDHEPAAVLRAVLAAYDDLPDDIASMYRADLATLGMRVRVEQHDGSLVGTAVDVDPDGRLVVLDECAITHRLSVGDIVHLRPA